jgi:hypothetical protein
MRDDERRNEDQSVHDVTQGINTANHPSEKWLEAGSRSPGFGLLLISSLNAPLKKHYETGQLVT